MSKQVDFYLIANEVADARFKLASRLANKLMRLNKKTLIVTDNNEESATLDNYLWSFTGTSFVAHERCDSDNNANAIIHLGEVPSIDKQVLDNNYDVLVNLATQAPIFCQHFARIAEIIEQQEQAKTNGRERYKSYKEQGFELKTHPLEL